MRLYHIEVSPIDDMTELTVYSVAAPDIYAALNSVSTRISKDRKVIGVSELDNVIFASQTNTTN